MEKNRKKQFEVDKEARKQRRTAITKSARVYARKSEESEIKQEKVIETSIERDESLSIVREMARSFAETMEFYKADWGGAKPHDEAFKHSIEILERRRECVDGLQPENVEWGHLAAIAEASPEDSLKLWARVREAAESELASGLRAAKVTGYKIEPYELAQFTAIRDSFADQWQPNGGIESAMIDMMTIAFSLQIYWSEIAHWRAVQIHNNHEKELRKYENKGWKSPYQHEADAVDQANRLADSYNRQFLRVLRQLRDLRRYAPVIIQNNGGQVNIGEQQVNMKQ